MARPTKVFELSVDQDGDPFPFDLTFTLKATGAKEVHHFEAVADPGFKLAYALGMIVRSDDKGKRFVDLGGILTFFSKCLDAGQFVMLESLVERQDIVIKIDDMFAVFEWLTDEYTGRNPTQWPLSSNGAQPTGQLLTESQP